MTATVTGADLAAALSLAYDPDLGDAVLDDIADAADAVLVSLLTTGDGIDHGTHAWCRVAGTAIATEMFTARTAVGGQPVSIDFTPGAYRLSAWLTRRVQTVCGACWDMRGWVG